MNVTVFDPTLQDDKSKVRGIGRYLQILRENFKDEFTFTDQLSTINYELPTVFVNPFFNLLQPPLTMFRVAKKQVAVIHDLIPLKYLTHFPVGLKGKLNIFLNKLALRNYDEVITDSEVSKKDIVDILGIDENKIKIIYPCLPKIFVDHPEFISESPLSVIPTDSDATSEKWRDPSTPLGMTNKNIGSFSNFCIYVGDATWNKNLVNVARAIKLADVPCIFVGKVFEILKQVQDDKLAIGGANAGIPTRAHPPIQRGALVGKHERQNLLQTNNLWQKELNEFLSLAKDDKRFIFPGFISDNELIQLYEQACLNILLSRDEGFGFSYVEAASLGCPSLLSDRPIFHEIAGANAEFVDPENPTMVAEVIKKYINNPAGRKQLGSKAQEQSKLYSQKQFKDAILKAIS
ncbi:glycosyltransferase [Candidatus Roizmanbacteria bacterium]|nr:glycosyltransferase [Candidatus Roizmanbacteria bacterium]